MRSTTKASVLPLLFLSLAFCFLGCASEKPPPEVADAEPNLTEPAAAAESEPTEPAGERPAPTATPLGLTEPRSTPRDSAPGVSLPHFEGATQRANNWCWAACLEMVYRQQGFHIRQEDFVNAQYQALIDGSATDTDMLRWLIGDKMTRNGTMILVLATYEAGRPNRSEIRMRFREGFIPLSKPTPIIVTVQGPVLGHAVVVHGYHETPDGRFMLHVYDPFPGRGETEWDLDAVGNWRGAFYPTLMKWTEDEAIEELRKILKDNPEIGSIITTLPPDVQKTFFDLIKPNQRAP